ncbi:MAG: aminotransferase class V-fold PLP-dependent enzyme [Pirellulales bacterium]|nr:aminotransferase class V-fold PLP-dependent enzyme [Pirellulales bacterium]
MTDDARIYLDNAATSWPKPEAVYAAVDDYQRNHGAPAGRSTYHEAALVERLVQRARKHVAALIGCADPKRVIFTFNGTDALNLAIHGLLADGDHVVTTVVEHNSVLRPLRQLERAGRIEVTIVGCDSEGIVDLDDLREAVRSTTRLIAISHASNVTGALQPIEEAAKICKQCDARLLVDAAQTVGCVPIDVARSEIDLLAAPGHKGLLGPLGTGILYVGPGVESELASCRQGGTGTQSDIDQQPDALPHKYESGNLNVPGIVGLAEGVEFVQVRTVSSIRDHELSLTGDLISGLTQLEGIEVFGPVDFARRVGVVSVRVHDFDPQEVAAMLDATCRVAVRSGLHCAPLMHRAIGTDRQGGTVRMSVGPFNTVEQIATTVQAFESVVANAL